MQRKQVSLVMQGGSLVVRTQAPAPNGKSTLALRDGKLVATPAAPTASTGNFAVRGGSLVFLPAQAPSAREVIHQKQAAGVPLEEAISSTYQRHTTTLREVQSAQVRRYHAAGMNLVDAIAVTYG